MLTLLADIAAAARETGRSYFTGLQVTHAAQLEAAASDARRGGVLVVHDHEQTTEQCTALCRLVAAPPMPNDPHR